MKTADLTGTLLDCWVAKALDPAEKVYEYSDGWGRTARTGRWAGRSSSESMDKSCGMQRRPIIIGIWPA